MCHSGCVKLTKWIGALLRVDNGGIVRVLWVETGLLLRQFGRNSNIFRENGKCVVKYDG